MLCINVFILTNRNNGYKYFPYKTYSQLYVTDSTLYLQDVHFDADTLQLFFSLPLASSVYKVVIDDSISNASVTSIDNSINITLRNNIHQYKLLPSNSSRSAIVVQADHDKGTGINELIYCSLPGPQIKVSSYNTWTKGIASFSKQEVKNGEEFLKKNTFAFSANTDSARLMEVCRLISSLRPNLHGMKADKASAQSPYQQVQLARQNKVNLNCGNYSAIFYFICSVLHLPNRLITFCGPSGNWQYGVHYYNEIYLREKQEWVLCDGLNNNYMPHDSLRFYNAADINKLAHTNSFKNKYVYTFQEGILKEVPYDSVNYWHWYYNRNNADLRYWHPGDDLHDTKWTYLKDFYSFNRNFDFYSDIHANDWLKIIIKITAFYLMLIIIALYIVSEIKSLRQGLK